MRSESLVDLIPPIANINVRMYGLLDFNVLVYQKTSTSNDHALVDATESTADSRVELAA
jgi:hypothetical protein